MRTKDIIGRVLRDVRRSGVTTSDITDEDIIDALNVGQNHIISEINPDKIITIEFRTGIGSYDLTTSPQEVIEGTTMANFITEDLIGNKNGSNVVFSFPTMPVEESEQIFYNGVKLKRGVDYTIVFDEEDQTAIVNLITIIPTSTDYLESSYMERVAV